MRTYQLTAFVVLDRYVILSGGHNSDAGVGSGCGRPFIDFYGFGFSSTLWNVFVMEMRDSVAFSVVQTVMEL